MEYMFTMMNNARLNVGLQGVAIAERAYQQARDYAQNRVQGRPMTAGRSDGPTPIAHHPDVRRMLLGMKTQTEAMRALAYYVAGTLDRSRHLEDPAGRAAWQARLDLLIPVVKAWSTDLGCEIASTGVQIHGGMGFVEETGAAQHYRDARILPIYEGTNGIQALDLLGRKVLRDEGAAARSFIEDMRALDPVLAEQPGDDLAVVRTALAAAIDTLADATRWLVQAWTEHPASAAAGATPYLRLFGTVAGGWVLAKGAVAAQAALQHGGGDARFHEAKLIGARFYAEQYLTGTASLAAAIKGGNTILAYDLDAL